MLHRSRLSLDGVWQFWIDPQQNRAVETLDIKDALTLDVPGPWQVHPDLRSYVGVGWYRRSVTLPDGWPGSGLVYLGFGAVDYFARVWVNGHLVGDHEGGYLPFEMEVSAFLHAGENTIVVRVDDPLAIFAEIPHGKQSWYGMLSGLWQPAWLELRLPQHIKRTKITTKDNLAQVEVELSNEPSPADWLDYQVISPRGEQVTRLRTTSTKVSLTIDSPIPWDIGAPNLYTVRVRLESSGDQVAETFGFRSIEARDGQLLLNGRPLYLRGALDQDYYPEKICTPPSLEYIKDEFRQAQHMGLNCLRVHIKVADPRYYQAADEVGLLIWTELPNHFILSPEARQRARQTLQGMVERDGNHPSIVIWSIINESWGIDLTDPAQRTWLVESYDFLKQLDPQRLVVDNSACWGNYHLVTDIEDFHNYYAIPDHYARWCDWVANFAARPEWTFAHPYSGYPGWLEFLRNPWASTLRSSAPEVRRTGKEPLVVSEFGNWGLPCVEQLVKGYGNEEPWWFESGLEWGEGVVYPHGILRRFNDFHLDRVFPSLAELSKASQRMQYLALKYEIEQIRRHNSIQGYVITEFTDVHWECNGLLDMHRNPKAHFDLLKLINADDFIVPDWQRVAYWSGEICVVDILVSHYSSLDLDQSCLEWQVNLPGNLVPARGRVEINGLAQGSARQVGLIQFMVPPVTGSVKGILEMVWTDRTGSQVARNELELYFFALPQQEEFTGFGHLKVHAPAFEEPVAALDLRLAGQIEAADLAITDTLTDDHRAYLLRGGRVLWMAEHSDSLQTNLPGLKIVARHGSPWQGDWASSFMWLCQDVMFTGLPVAGMVDFAFAGLTPEHVITGLAPREFALAVHVGLCVGWLHKAVALVAERRVGPGKLLISTFRLRENLQSNPVAAWVFHELLRHSLQP